jgi:hypothetical protein
MHMTALWWKDIFNYGQARRFMANSYFSGTLLPHSLNVFGYVTSPLYLKLEVNMKPFQLFFYNCNYYVLFFFRVLVQVTYTYCTMVNECQTAPLLQMVLFMPFLDLWEVKEVST